ncbi:MAG: peptidylprolyl isomerase [Mucilaginibacter sp.]|jgi:FKBP-type peptidyl-prolyl cis-trans isomerase|nr:peptidylprolyl isomerase [Mucilaginibacter sp.]
MNKYILVLSLFIGAFSSCKKTGYDPVKQAATDDAAIQAYIKANNITAVKDPSGLYYQVITPGTGSYPNVNSLITGAYSGKLLNGTVFDSGPINNTALSGYIKGWQIGVPHINTGGRILLLIPSALGYGNAANGGIPANSVLIFTIDLTGFSN